MESNLKIGTLNCRGLLSYQKQESISKFILHQNLDILFLQETNVKSLSVAKAIEAKFCCKAFWSFATQKCTGSAILVFSSNFKIDHFEFDINGRLVLLDSSYDNLKFRFINIYAHSSDRTERVKFLSTLFPFLGTSRKIILGGDFNCILNSTLDKVGGNPDNGMTGSKECLAFCKDFSLVDSYRYLYPKSVCTTWHSQNVHARLDRFYISKSLSNNIVNVSVTPTSMTMTDHDLVTFELKLADPVPLGTGYWKINNSILNDRSFVLAFTKFWKQKMDSFELSIENWDILKKEIKTFVVAYCKRKSNVTRNLINSLRKKYSQLQKLSSHDPKNYIDQVNCIREEITQLQEKYQHGAFIRSKCNFLDFSEKPSKYFYMREKDRSEKKIIRNLKLDGKDLSDNDSIINAFRNFYIDLFTKQEIDTDLMNEFLTDLPHLDSNQATFCEGPITSDEILSALQSMQNNKSPGPDGLSKEFYLTFFNLMSPTLVRLYCLIYEKGILTPSQRTSYISLICKDPNNSEQMKNWRPISLLNYDYKIVSKIMATRLGGVIENIVHPDQSSSIKSRSILDNCHLLRNIYDYVTEKQIPCAWINLDFLKAFDQISWQFLFETLHAYGFKSSFINWIKILYNDASSSVLVNNHISEPFKLYRGVRQGCAISPLLFVICLEPLATKVRNEKDITGLPLPGKNQNIKQTIFADDYTGILTTNKGMSAFLFIVKLYCKASGSALNLTKTNGFFLGKWCTRSDHPFGISWPEFVKLLGVKYGPNISMDDVWNPILLKFQKVLNYWKIRHLTLKQKSIVLVSSACSKLWYVGSIFHMSKYYLKQFEHSIFKFLWPKAKYEPLSRKTQYLHFHQGGLNIPHIGAKLKALRLKHLIHYMFGDPSNWHHFTNYWCALPLRKFQPSLWSNLCPHSNQLGPFYKKCIKNIQELAEIAPDFDFEKGNVKLVYKLFVKAETSPPRCIRLFPGHDLNKTFKNLHDPFIDPYSRDVCYKIIMQILPVTHLLCSTYHLIPSAANICSFCKRPHETYEHLFYYCPAVASLKNILSNLLSHFNVSLKFDMVYLLSINHNDKYSKAVVLFLCTEYVKTIWLNRNLAKFEHRPITSDSLIMSFVNYVKLRISCDYHRLSLNDFKKYWCQNTVFCTLERDNLNIKFAPCQ